MKLRHHITTICSALLFISACSPHSLFYYPNRRLYSDPTTRGISYEMIEIPSLNGKKLSAALFETTQIPKGTVVHFHGNFGNVSCHYIGSQFLTNYGFDVLVFDYEGYGVSEGKPSPKNTVNDGLAVIRYAQANLRSQAKGVVVLGQSLGAAVATVAVAKEPLVKAAVLEAGFYSYRAIARAVLERSVLTWPAYPFFPLFLGSTYDPIRYVGQISPRPVLFIHGTDDIVVPVSMSKKLFEAAREPKRLWIINGAGHLECHRLKGKEYEETIANFFTEALQK